MTSIERAILPLIFVLCMCGFYVFEYPQGRPRLYLTIFYILTSWLLIIYLMVQMKTFTDKFIINRFWIILFIGVATEIFILINIHHHKKFKSCLKKLDIVNSTLEEFGMQKNYAQLRARMIWMLIGWTISVIFMNSVQTVGFFANTSKSNVAMDIYAPYVINYSAHISTLYVTTFIILLRYIGSLFEHVNQSIQKLIEQKTRQVRLAWTTSTTSSLIHRHFTDASKSNQLICLLMHVHFELSSISRELNKIFGLKVAMQMTIFHINALQFFILLYNNIVGKSYFENAKEIGLFYIFVWAIRCNLEIFFLNDTCEKLYKKANRTETFLNILANLTFDVESQENITQFLLQILRRPLRITALGFYDYGYKFTRKFIERAVKIIIIVIQAR